MSEDALDTTLGRIIAERRQKGDTLRQHGRTPYPTGWTPTHSLMAVRTTYEPTKPAGEPTADHGITPIDGTIVRVAGRIMAKRGFGKTVFAPIRDESGDVQLYLNVEAMEPADFAAVLPALDAGDIVGAEGPAFWTKRGELSILVKRLTILSKSLRPLPDKWHGMTDQELRYRQRYVDLVVSPDVRNVFRRRSQIVRGIRRFLDERGFLEVETPMMHSIIGGAAARPFTTHHNALDMPLYMRIAPELYLKRLVVGGFERVFEIGRNFRNEGLSRQHNPEFTMLEFYWAYATYQQLMDLTEEMVRKLALEVCGTTKLTWGDATFDVGVPWRRLSVRAAIQEVGGIANAADVFTNPVTATQVALEVGVPAVDVARVLLAGAPSIRGEAATTWIANFKAAPDIAARLTLATHATATFASDLERRIRAGHLGYLIFEVVAEAKLVEPTFITDFPVAVSPLARANDADPSITDRFELFVCGKEIANGFSELNDPDDQRRRFAAQMDAKANGTDETMDYDEDYCRALEFGLPPTAGEGIGIDRLVMMLTNQASIRDVLLFPLMRHE